jgi:hypothetical protein
MGMPPRISLRSVLSLRTTPPHAHHYRGDFKLELSNRLATDQDSTLEDAHRGVFRTLTYNLITMPRTQDSTDSDIVRAAATRLHRKCLAVGSILERLDQVWRRMLNLRGRAALTDHIHHAELEDHRRQALMISHELAEQVQGISTSFDALHTMTLNSRSAMAKYLRQTADLASAAFAAYNQYARSVHATCSRVMNEAYRLYTLEHEAKTLTQSYTDVHGARRTTLL